MAFTQRTIDTVLNGDSSKRVKLRDEAVRGLLLRVGPRDAVWSYEWRPRGMGSSGRRAANKALKLGTVQTMALAEARTAALSAKQIVVEGGDPAIGRERHRAATARWTVPITEVLPLYVASLEGRNKSPKHARDEALQVRRAFETVNLSTAAVAAMTVVAVHRVVDEAPAGSKRARLGALHRFLRWCKSRGFVDEVATAAIERADRPSLPISRDRVLSLEELARLLHAVDVLPVSPVRRNLVLFIIATACRREEAATAEWAHIDMVRSVWNQPGLLTKNRLAHIIPLNGTAVRAIGPAGIGLVFPSPTTGGVMSGWSELKDAIDRVSQVTTWRLHDVRRTFASHLAERGIDETTVDLCLNHRASSTRSGVMGVYQRSARLSDRARAMEEWHTVLDEARAMARG